MSMQIVTPGQTRTRKMRKPLFNMAGRMRPFGLYPLMITPVLPGETMEFASFKMRALSMPLRNPLFGAWLETWLCYVKLTDLDRALSQMFISDTVPTTGRTAAADKPRMFTRSGQIDWVQLCLDRIMTSYFLNEGETAQTVDGVPRTKMVNNNWAQNLMFRPAGVTEAQLPSNPDGQLTGFQLMQMMQMSEMTYEKYLEQYGVENVRELTEGTPEMLRYTRSWVQPVNTVEATTGAPSSAWSWSDNITSEKPKRFNEPGFLLMLGAIRPKMLQGSLQYSMVGNLWGFADWFPVYNLEDPAAGIKVMNANDPVFNTTYRGTDVAPGASLLYDHRDLLTHGEQFINAPNADLPYPVPLSTYMRGQTGDPVERLRGEYTLDADIDNLFTGSTANTRLCYYEGVGEIRIAGHVKDTTL